MTTGGNWLSDGAGADLWIHSKIMNIFITKISLDHRHLSGKQKGTEIEQQLMIAVEKAV